MNCWLVRKNFTSLLLKAFTGPMAIFDGLQNKSDIQTLKTECYCLLAECHMSLALHGKYELELAAQKALELLHYVSDITNVDGKILAIMGLITGLSGQAKVSHILFEQAKIHTTDIASLYYYRALVNFHNERIEEARICIDKSLQLEPRRRKAVVIKECVDMYVPNPLKSNMKLYYKETSSESHRVIIDNILKLKQLTRIVCDKSLLSQFYYLDVCNWLCKQQR
ncbi:putative invasion genes regulator [Escherichia coli]|uniref:Putative invasion genes regulator n=1 Tax=Escherichia coli TaxID=562 RepID=A0A377D6W6_ECOLX|nr:putative invasion genes regulator [Escherichia coli]